jgi:hypothetical protein
MQGSHHPTPSPAVVARIHGCNDVTQHRVDLLLAPHVSGQGAA